MGIPLLFFYFSGHWKEDWLSMMHDMNTGVVAVEKLRSCLEQEEAASAMGLSEIYPCGYALFAVDQDGNHVESQTVPEGEVGIDWDRLRIVQVAANAVYLVPPAVFSRGSACIMSGAVVAVSRVSPRSVILCYLDRIRLHLGLVRDRGDVIVLVLGCS